MVDALDSSRVAPEGDRCRTAAKSDVAQVSDIGLVVAISRGDRDALREVYRRHGDQLYGLARRLCGPGPAEDVVQEVFLEMWQKPERFDSDRGPLRNFLMTQVHGRSVDRLRSDGARRPREAAEVLREPSRGVDVEADVTLRLAGDEVWRLLVALPDGQRDAIVLASFEGHTYCDVAGLLEQPEGTVKRRIRAALTRLRVELSDDGCQDKASLI
jgi:RNA polymerase sigma-70 factor, ECF subfamily